MNESRFVVLGPDEAHDIQRIIEEYMQVEEVVRRAMRDSLMVVINTVRKTCLEGVEKAQGPENEAMWKDRLHAVNLVFCAFASQHFPELLEAVIEDKSNMRKVVALGGANKIFTN